MLGIGTTVIGGVLLSFVLDGIKGIGLWSTLATVTRFVINSIIYFLNINLKVWWVLLAVAILFAALLFISKALDEKEKKASPTFLTYKRDTMFGYGWEWNYKETYEGKYIITDLHAICPKCGMRLKQGGLFGTEKVCIRCNTSMHWENELLTDVEMMIEDNIKNSIYK